MPNRPIPDSQPLLGIVSRATLGPFGCVSHPGSTMRDGRREVWLSPNPMGAALRGGDGMGQASLCLPRPGLITGLVATHARVAQSPVVYTLWVDAEATLVAATVDANTAYHAELGFALEVRQGQTLVIDADCAESVDDLYAKVLLNVTWTA
jgi:hypothetical protein